MEMLIDIMKTDSALAVREAATNALGSFSLLAEHDKLPPGATPMLSRALLGVYRDDDTPVDIRRRALEAVAPLSLPEVRRAIMAAYHSDDFKLKVSAVYAMGKNCHPDWLDILLEEMDSDDPELRYEAAVASGELGEEPSVPRLIELTEDDDPDVRLAALQALGKIGGSEAREHLELHLEDPSEAVRQVAEQALNEIEMIDEPTSMPWIKMRRPE
jgi:HEAT repeat protein